MHIIKDRRTKTIDIHFDGECGVYAMVTRGRQKWDGEAGEATDFGSIYLSFSEEMAVKIAKQILSKFKGKK